MPTFIPSTANAADIRVLADLFTHASVGDTITYAAMSEALGSDVRNRRWLIQKAIKLVAEESAMGFGTVRDVGQIRLEKSDAVSAAAHRRHVRTTSRKKRIMIGLCVKGANDEVKRKASAESAALGLIEWSARDRVVAKLHDYNRPIPVEQVMRDMFARLGITPATQAAE